MSNFSRKKRFLFYLIALFFIILILEAFSFFLYYAVTRRAFSFSKVNAEKLSLINEEENPLIMQRTKSIEIIHPYTGYIYNPDSNSDDMTKYHGFPISDYGFLDDKSPILKKNRDRIIIGITGGSVAYWFSVLGQDSLRNSLMEHPLFSNKDIVFIRLALGGYKQPQQVLLLSYLLTLGAEFDIIINIDGFNEVALPPSENLPKNVNPFYPRNWYMRVSDVLEGEMRYTVERIHSLRKRRRLIAGIFNSFPLRYSISLNLVWSYINRMSTREIYENQLILSEYTAEESTYMITGPSFQYTDNNDLYSRLAEIWYNASIQLYRICSSNNIAYFHFLQPNQYTEDKTLSPEEQKSAYDENHPYRTGVIQGYPFLRDNGKKLRDNNICFHDLTEIFSDIEDTIYIDACCHYNEIGNRIIAEEIASAVKNYGN